MAKWGLKWWRERVEGLGSWGGVAMEELMYWYWSMSNMYCHRGPLTTLNDTECSIGKLQRQFDMTYSAMV